MEMDTTRYCIRRLKHQDAKRQMVAWLQVLIDELTLGHQRILKRHRLSKVLRRRQRSYLYIVEHAGMPVSTATLNIVSAGIVSKRHGEVEDVVTLSDHRGLGIGRALMTTLIDRARQVGCRFITLSCREEREPARELYRSLGFVQQGDSKWFLLDLTQPATT